jgi:hypothetical protein
VDTAGNEGCRGDRRLKAGNCIRSRVNIGVGKRRRQEWHLGRMGLLCRYAGCCMPNLRPDVDGNDTLVWLAWSEVGSMAMQVAGIQS